MPRHLQNGYVHVILFHFINWLLTCFSDNVTMLGLKLQGIDYLKYDNCNSDGSKPTVRYK